MLKNLDPQDLKLHPICRHLPHFAKDDARFHNIIESIRENGVVTPLLLVEPDLVVDIDGRLAAAQRLQLKTLPCRVITEAEAPAAVLAILQRWHLTKSGLAYFAYPAIKPAFRAALDASMARSKTGGVKPKGTISDPIGNGPSVAGIAASLGICQDLLKMAEKVHEAFDRDHKEYSFTVRGGAQDGEVVECTLKQWFEPRILGETTLDEHEGNRHAMGLAAVLKAIGSIKTYQTTLGNSRPEPDQLELFVGSILAPVKKWGSYTRLDPAGKKAALERFRAQLEAMSEAQREETSRAMVDIAAFYERLAKECEDAKAS